MKMRYQQLIFLFLFFMIKSSALSQNDVNYEFSLNEYADFLRKALSNPLIVFVTQRQLMTYHDSTKIVISIRHDIDADMDNALRMARLEHNFGVHATYYVLSTAGYYCGEHKDFSHQQSVLSKIKQLQALGHEVGWHNNVLTLQVVYGIDPLAYMHRELAWLRSNGIKIDGTAAHGSRWCSKYGYLNYYMWKDCGRRLYNKNYPNFDYVVKSPGDTVWLAKAWLKDFGFKYEAYCLDYNKYYSDCCKYYDPLKKIDLDKLKPGDRITILMHPCHWHWDRAMRLVKLFPNPISLTRGLFHCEFNFKVTSRIQLFITDLNGRLLFCKIYSPAENIAVPFNFEQRGIYYVYVETVVNGKMLKTGNCLLVY
jgi:hypothetical protein